MKLGRVIGNVWATRKEDFLVGVKFLVIQLEDPNGRSVEEIVVAADRIGAGNGDLVLVTIGSAARYIFGESWSIDAVVIGIVDSVEAEVRTREPSVGND